MNELLNIILSGLFFILPAGIANMVPVFVKDLKFLNIPIDNNKTFRGKPIFGKNKTWRGLVFATLAGGLVFYLQRFLLGINFFKEISIIDYAAAPILLGFLLGFGAIFGDLIESFFKRQLNIKSGRPWPVFDQMDFVIGALLFSFIIFIPPWQIVVAILVVTPILHPILSFLGYYLGLKKDKW
ncbi:CDP-2,3-bis-(O-geranylgeranyl)-sn-glycerol synthase [Nanoarchaeota archaeon]